jgi:hypothetical protein
VTGDQVLERADLRAMRAEALSRVRGTVQADILKEDQAQNTCIFSTEFALRMMGDVQQYFIDNEGAQLLLGVDLRLSHRRSRREPDLAARLHARQRLHHRRVLPGARHEDRRLRAEPVVLLLQRHGSGVRGDRPRGAAHLGARHARAVRRRSAQPDAEVPHPDLGPLAARAGDPVQRHPHHAAGAVRAVRQLQLAAHQRLRRGAHHADRGERAARGGHPAHHQRELGLNKNQNPWQGSLHHRVADRPGRRGRVQGVRIDLRARRRARRDGDHVPARQDPGRVAVLRDARSTTAALPLIGVNTFLMQPSGSFHQVAGVVGHQHAGSRRQCRGAAYFQSHSHNVQHSAGGETRQPPPSLDTRIMSMMSNASTPSTASVSQPAIPLTCLI